MTGRELIIYILENNLENEVIELNPSIFTKGFMTFDEVAAKFDVGAQTVHTWVILGLIRGITICDQMYFSKDVRDPRETK